MSLAPSIQNISYSLAIRSVSVVLPKSCSSYGQLLVLLFLSRHCCLADDFNTLRPPRLESEKDITKYRQSTSHNFIVLPSDKLDYSLIACTPWRTYNFALQIHHHNTRGIITYIHAYLTKYLFGEYFRAFPVESSHFPFSNLSTGFV